jgi:hypothetical protein
MSEFAQRECRPLMEVCTNAIYNTNSFRVLGVPVTATSRQIKRRMDELKLAVEMDDLEEEYTHALSPSLLPDMDDLRRAAKQLEDPQTRFVDEFFWFWPLNWEEADSDKGLRALDNGNQSEAESFWVEHLAGFPETERLAATHNLAVLNHVLAIDMEHACHKNETPPLPTELEQLNSLWHTSFDWWEKLVDHEGFWDLLRDRVLAINDPSLSTGFVLRFRSVFPVAFDNINADFAAVHSKNGKHSRAALHIQFMQETHDGLDDVDESLSKVTRPLHSRIDATLNRATENLHDDPKDGINRADRLLAETAEPLKALATLLGSGHAEVKETQDEVVEACCNCAITYGNATEEWASGVVLLEKLRGIAASEKVKSRVETNLDIVRKNHETKQLQKMCWFCKKSKAETSANIAVEMYGNVTRERQFLGPTQIRWNHLKIDVPRCSSCKSIHERISWEWMIAVASVFIGGISSSWIASDADFFFLGAIIGFAIGLTGLIIIYIKFKKPKTASLSTKDCFPQIKELQAEGWRFGSRPPEANG